VQVIASRANARPADVPAPAAPFAPDRLLAYASSMSFRLSMPRRTPLLLALVLAACSGSDDTTGASSTSDGSSSSSTGASTSTSSTTAVATESDSGTASGSSSGGTTSTSTSTSTTGTTADTTGTTADTTGTTGTTAATTGTTGGAACPGDPGDDACTSCLKTNCCDEITACDADAKCTCFFTCVGEGKSPVECAGTCMVGNPGQNPAIAGTFECTNASCSNECL